MGPLESKDNQRLQFVFSWSLHGPFGNSSIHRSGPFLGFFSNFGTELAPSDSPCVQKDPLTCCSCFIPFLTLFLSLILSFSGLSPCLFLSQSLFSVYLSQSLSIPQPLKSGMVFIVDKNILYKVTSWNVLQSYSMRYERKKRSDAERSS